MDRRLLFPGVLALALACAPSRPEPAVPSPEPTPAPVPAPAPKPRVRDTVAVKHDSIVLPDLPSSRPPDLPVTVSLTGDINLGTSTLPGGIPPDEGRGLLPPVSHALVGDLVIGNYEGTLADTGTTDKCPEPDTTRNAPRKPRMCYVFLTPLKLGARLADAGFTHMNLANNHANDYGIEGRRSTEAELHRLGIKTYGPLGQISVDTVRRGDSLTVVGLIGFATYGHSYNLLDIPASVRVVDSLRDQVDLVLVTFHGGAEGSRALHTPDTAEFIGNEPRGSLRKWARAVIDAGASAVVGHGPHVLRGIEFHRGRPIVYSLGNFLTYRGFNLSGPNGITAILQMKFTGSGDLISARIVPLRQPPREGPEPDPSGAAIDLMRRLSQEDFGLSAARFLEDGSVLGPL